MTADGKVPSPLTAPPPAELDHLATLVHELSIAHHDHAMALAHERRTLANHYAFAVSRGLSHSASEAAAKHAAIDQICETITCAATIKSLDVELTYEYVKIGR